MFDLGITAAHTRTVRAYDPKTLDWTTWCESSVFVFSCGCFFSGEARQDEQFHNANLIAAACEAHGGQSADPNDALMFVGADAMRLDVPPTERLPVTRIF